LARRAAMMPAPTKRTAEINTRIRPSISCTALFALAPYGGGLRGTRER
jgi:hypothetical protein